ncbi:glycosyltransferase [Aromatoleum aromaticum]|uniref:glycosyltransferase n=1 Tax=Aromatoleum aromaticum TaxID=551760 RepID=UPI001459AA63|nr:glycosyltransferase [Aromatoleum aromaticum]NMG55439.1 glycosyltransferase [Aromatoleum aromaticum]
MKQELPYREKFNVLFFTGFLDNQLSGPYLTLKQTAEHLAQRGNKVSAIGTRNDSVGNGFSDWVIPVKAFQSYGPKALHFSPSLVHWLYENIRNSEILSVQAVWLYGTKQALALCKKNGLSLMITAHGNFNPPALKMSKWKKSLAKRTFLKNVLENVDCYQALTETEYLHIRNYGIKKPVCVIGNGIDIPELLESEEVLSILNKDLTKRRTCLYLGRLHPIKGIERLLGAWADLMPDDNWQLVIAGSGDEIYVKSLMRLAEEKKCRNVFFVGPVFGDEKAAWLQYADFMVLPSYSEAFAMAPMEGLSRGTPALITDACNFPEANSVGAALEVPSTADGVLKGLEQMLSHSESTHVSMGRIGRSFVQDRYSWDYICDELEKVYVWLRNGGNPPSCVRVD